MLVLGKINLLWPPLPLSNSHFISAVPTPRVTRPLQLERGSLKASTGTAPNYLCDPKQIVYHV